LNLDLKQIVFERGVVRYATSIISSPLHEGQCERDQAWREELMDAMITLPES